MDILINYTEDIYFFIIHKSFWKRTKNGINSKRPASMSIINMNLVIGSKELKLPIGPITCPSPGPMFPIDAIEPTKAITVSFSIIAIKNAEIAISAK